MGWVYEIDYWDGDSMSYRKAYHGNSTVTAIRTLFKLRFFSTYGCIKIEWRPMKG